MILGLPTSCEACTNTEILEYLHPSTTTNSHMPLSGESSTIPSNKESNAAAAAPLVPSRDIPRPEHKAPHNGPVPRLPLPPSSGQQQSASVENRLSSSDEGGSDHTKDVTATISAGVDELKPSTVPDLSELWPKREVDILKLQIAIFEKNATFTSARVEMDFEKLKVLKAEKNALMSQLTQLQAAIWSFEELCQQSSALSQTLENRCQELIDDDAQGSIEAAEQCHVALRELRELLGSAPQFNATLMSREAPLSEDLVPPEPPAQDVAPSESMPPQAP